MHIVRKITQSKPRKITCGLMRKLTDNHDFKNMDLVHVTVDKATKKHYHKKLTEVYYVLKGAIKVVVDGRMEKLNKGSMIMIYPKTNHQAWKTSQGKAELLVVCCPPWCEADEILS